MHHARSVVIEHLYSWELNPIATEDLVKEAHEANPELPMHLSCFITLMLTNITEKQSELDSAVAPYLKKWTIDRLSKIDLNILRLAVYELLYQQETDAAIVIDEAVKLAQDYSSDDSHKFVNGVLEAFAKGNKINVGKKEIKG